MKADHPAVPVTTREIALASARCHEAGAAAVHAHLRDKDGAHSLDIEGCRNLIATIRGEAGPELVIQVTTEAVGRYSPAEQRALVDAIRPDAASVALGEMIPDAAHEAEGAAFYARSAARGVAIQHILYTPDEVTRLADFIQRGIVPDKGLSVLFVLGRYTRAQQSNPVDLVPFVTASASAGLAPVMMVCAFGRGEIASIACALALGGHGRVGFENSLTGPDGVSWQDNTEPVAAAAAIATALRRRRPDRDETLRLLGRA